MHQAELYTSFAADPYFNMAFDEWLLARAAGRSGYVAVRLYSWLPGAITFGVHQKEEKAFREDFLGDTPVIRRVTGGRALYHDPSELTYAIAVNNTEEAPPELSGSLSQSSKQIGRALASFVEASGLDAQFLRRSRGESTDRDFFHSAPCFVSAARHEVMSGGGKVVASAQRQFDFGFLQHGSIKLAGIAPHPALPGLGQTIETSQVPQPMTRPEFDLAVNRFSAIITRQLSLHIVPESLTADDNRQLAAAVREVKKNCRARRDSIEQIISRGSL